MASRPTVRSSRRLTSAAATPYESSGPTTRKSSGSRLNRVPRRAGSGSEGFGATGDARARTRSSPAPAGVADSPSCDGVSLSDAQGQEPAPQLDRPELPPSDCFGGRGLPCAPHGYHRDGGLAQGPRAPLRSTRQMRATGIHEGKTADPRAEAGRVQRPARRMPLISTLSAQLPCARHRARRAHCLAQ
jgi:hypothetical protein